MARSHVTAIERAAEKTQAIAQQTPAIRTELLALAGIGKASQARAVARAFRVLEAALFAEDKTHVGRGPTARYILRPNWEIRVKAARIVWEILGAAAQYRLAGGTGTGHPAVTINLAEFNAPRPVTIVADGVPVRNPNELEDADVSGQCDEATEADEAFRQLLAAQSAASADSGTASGTVPSG